MWGKNRFQSEHITDSSEELRKNDQLKGPVESCAHTEQKARTDVSLWNPRWKDVLILEKFVKCVEWGDAKAKIATGVLGKFPVLTH